ncbi:MAG: polysaccharide biosynthesis C-terminal domain-containing protein [Bacteroidales bacterium]|nr:polysaccharide biosynthesis C-terminal domain-containing protein [Bacteroidales bacterium]
MVRQSFLQDVTKVLSSNVFTIINGLIISIILSRQLGPSGFGLYSAILVVPLIVISITQLGIRASAIYFIGNKKYKTDLIVSNILMILIFSSLLGVVTAGVVFFVMNDENFSILMILLVLLIIPPRLAAIQIGGIFLGLEQIKKAMMLNWLTIFINLISVIVLVWILAFQINGALLSMLIAYCIITGWAFFVIRKEHIVIFKPDFHIIKNLLKKGIVFALAFLIIQLNYRIDILILKELVSLKEVGYYSLGASIAEKLWQLPLAIGIVLMSRTANATDQQAINISTAKLFRVSLIAGVMAAGILFVITPVVVPAIWGKDFQPSIRILQFILPGILFISQYRILSSRLSGIGLPQIAIYVFFPALIINIVLNYWWIPLYGAMGAVMATNASYTFGSIIFLFVYAKVVKMPVSEMLSYKKTDFDFLIALKRKFL